MKKWKELDRETRLDIIELTRAYLGVLLLSILFWSEPVMGMYAGESTTFPINLTNPVYTVVGNASAMEGLSVGFENGNITIVSDPMMASDNFTMIFFDEVTREVVKTIHTVGGSGGRRTTYVDRNVTTYVPVTTTETIEVEKVVEKVINSTKISEPKETGYKLWNMFLMFFVGWGFAWFVIKNFKKEEEVQIEDAKNEMVKKLIEEKEG